MKEYRIAKGWRIFLYIMTPMLLGLFGWVIMAPFIYEGFPKRLMYLTIIGGVVMLVVIILGFIDAIKGKVLVSEDGTLSVRSVFINRDLAFNEIKGFIIGNNHIFVLPSVDTKKQIKVSNSIGDLKGFMTWLVTNFPDLVKIEAEKEEVEILQNLEYGDNSKDRIKKLKSAKFVAKGLNWIGGVICAWTVFSATPYEYVLLVSIAFPIVVIVIMFFFNGLLRIDGFREGTYPVVFIAFFFPALGLALRAMLDYEIFNYSNVWMPVLGIALTLVIGLSIASKQYHFDKAKDFFSVFGLFIFCFVYGYGALISLNCFYDKTASINYQAKVLEKRISVRKTTTYYLTLSPWGERFENKDVSVTKALYDVVNNNDNVTVAFYKGKFNIPWFEVTE